MKIRDLCQYDMGPTSTANIWYARECAERGYDGLVHIKSAGCTPEIDVMPVLQNISADHKIHVHPAVDLHPHTGQLLLQLQIGKGVHGGIEHISADHKIPVLYLTYDAQTSDVGLMTRLEAFYDMIAASFCSSSRLEKASMAV